MKNAVSRHGCVILGIFFALATAAWADNPVRWNFKVKTSGEDVSQTYAPPIDDGALFSYTYNVNKITIWTPGLFDDMDWNVTGMVDESQRSGSDTQAGPYATNGIDLLDESFSSDGMGATISARVNSTGNGEVSITDVTLGTYMGVRIKAIQVEGTVDINRLVELQYGFGTGGELSFAPMGVDDTTYYAPNTSVLVTATPKTGYRVRSWTVDGVEEITSATTKTFVMTQDTVVYVDFTEAYSLTMGVAGNVGGTIDASPKGTNDSYNYDPGTVVTVTATPAAGYRVKGWTINDVYTPSRELLTQQLTMNQNYNVVITYEKTYTLTTSVDGTGGTIAPAGETICAEGDVVMITTSPDENFFAKTWTVDGQIDTAADLQDSYLITMDADHTVSVAFIDVTTSESYTLTTEVISGQGTLTPVATKKYPAGAKVILTAIPENGYRLVADENAWDGTDDDASRALTNVVTMDRDRDVTVAFEIIPEMYQLTCIVASELGGTLDPAGLTVHEDGDVVTITATPDAGYAIASWSGTGSDDVLNTTKTVVMTQNRFVTVTFVRMYTLTTEVASGKGTLTPLGEQSLAVGTIVKLMAKPTAGWRVKAWSGTNDDALKTTTNTVTMGADRQVSVAFEAIPITAMDVIGNEQVDENSSISFTAKATTDEGATLNVTTAATWAVIDGPGAINASGVYSAPTSVTIDTPATIEATYTNDAGTISQKKQIMIVNRFASPVSVTITGPATLPETSTGQYKAIVTFDDDTTVTTTTGAKWSVTSGVGLISYKGVYFAPNSVDQTEDVTIHAKYSKNGMTVESDLPIQVTRSLPESLTIVGASEIAEASTSQYRAMVSYDNGRTLDVTSTATWTLMPATAGSNVGTIAAGLVTAPQSLMGALDATIAATMTVDGVVLEATKDVTLANSIRSVTSLEIVGPTKLSEGETYTYSVRATYDDGGTEARNAEWWTVDLRYTKITPNGVMTVKALSGAYIKMTITAEIGSQTAKLAVEINKATTPTPGDDDDDDDDGDDDDGDDDDNGEPTPGDDTDDDGQIIPGFCFVATAAYGSYMDDHVATLRNFRDECLMTSTAGRCFVNTYYTVSPRVAEVIAHNPSLRSASRALLMPMITAIEYPQLAMIVMAAMLVLLHQRRALGRFLAEEGSEKSSN